ncbi:MAG: acetolactate synthase large subunit, partial [Candidatus Hydrogenedentes bacterium]|nr:acetolactate synthase large subunit [Candidatus Hydrogenedentota bacterium]
CDKKIICIDFLPAVVDHNYQLDCEVIGDVAHTLWMMNERLKESPLRFDLPQQHATRQQMLRLLEEYKEDDTQGKIRPQKALWDVRQAMGPHDILLSDVGSHKMWIAQYYHCDEPNTCLIPNGFCSMGGALPGAIAAKLVHPNRKVMAVCGDGGFLMNVQELETAKRLGMNIVVMVWQDNAFNLIEWKQRKEFGHHTDCSFGNPDFVKLAEAFGCVGMNVENSRDLAPALEQAFSFDVPVVISLPIDYRENDRLNEQLRIVV